MIIKLTHKNTDYYLRWSSIVDAPVTWGLSLDELKAFYKEEFGNSGLRDLDKMLIEVEAKGFNGYMYKTLKEALAVNRAGKGERCVSIDYIIKHYCLLRDL